MMRRFGRRWIVGTCATRISAAGPYGGGDDFVIIYLEKKSSPLKKGLTYLPCLVSLAALATGAAPLPLTAGGVLLRVPQTRSLNELLILPREGAQGRHKSTRRNPTTILKMVIII